MNGYQRVMKALRFEPADREANAIIDLFGNRGGLILSSACEIPRHTKAENVRALTDAAWNYPYDGGNL